MRKNREMNVFDFCIQNKKMSTNDLLSWLDIDLEYGDMTDLGKVYLRRIGDGNLFEISEPKATFDRWANSADFCFDINRLSERRAFIRYIESIRQEDVVEELVI